MAKAKLEVLVTGLHREFSHFGDTSIIRFAVKGVCTIDEQCLGVFITAKIVCMRMPAVQYID